MSDLQNKLNDLKKICEEANIAKATAQANLDNAKKKKEELIADAEKLAGHEIKDYDAYLEELKQSIINIETQLSSINTFDLESITEEDAQKIKALKDSF